MHMNNGPDERKFRLLKVGQIKLSDLPPNKPAMVMARRGQWTEDKVSIAKAMRNRGDHQHDIAAWFGVNGGRIGEIDRKWPWVRPSKGPLPPRGPYDIPGLLAARDTARRRMASASNDIVEACAEIEKRFMPDQRKAIEPFLNKLLRCGVRLEQRL